MEGKLLLQICFMCLMNCVVATYLQNYMSLLGKTMRILTLIIILYLFFIN